MNRIACFVLVATLALGSTASAQVFSTTDDSVATVAAPPMPMHAGINADFGGQIGTGVMFAWDSDLAGNLTLDVLGGACTRGGGFADHAVIYIDSDRTTGFADTTLFQDNTSPVAAAASGVSAAALVQTPLGFAPGFTADYAIVFTNTATGSAAFLVELRTGGAAHIITPLLSVQLAGCAALRIAGLDMTMLNSSPNAAFNYVATLIDVAPNPAVRSNEFQGAATVLPAGTPGTMTYSMMAGEFNTFDTIDPVLINEVDADQSGTDSEEFIELFSTTPSVRLDGSVLVLYNGSDDASYDAIDLDGETMGADGYWVIGSAGVANVDRTEFTTNGIQNGTDGVGFHLGDETDFPNDTPVSATNLFDGVVYDTNDGDDTVLIAALTPGQPQLNEDGNRDKDLESNQRCPDAAGGAFVTDQYGHGVPTPGAANACQVCGNGTTEAGEDCDDGTDNGTSASCCTFACEFQPVDTACDGTGVMGACDAADTCDAFGVCVDNVESVTTTCRPMADDCDVDEMCDGVNKDCPTDTFMAAGTECRASAGVCDVAETCTGTDAACPADAFEPDTTSCRAGTGGLCDAEEFCTGSSVDCPADGVEAAGTVCRGSADLCDAEEVCDGATAACPADIVEAAGVECRASVGDCDIAETCDGAAAACPMDAFVAAGMECRAAAGACDIAEACTGASGMCPTDAFEPSTTICNMSTGVCDPEETCTGSDADCPADVVSLAGTVCRTASLGGCDVAEACDGTAVDCPADGFAAAGTECRGSAGTCDVAETCSGADDMCPVDGFVAAGTTCRASAGVCDVAESCTGSMAACPMDMFATDGTACADGTACNGDEVCMAGACTAGTAVDCDDVDMCTTDMCNEPGGTCTNDAIAGCCNIDADCDDTNVCTADVCSGPGGTCTNDAITDCCTMDSDCDDGNMCTNDMCNTTTNRCERTPVAGCCTEDADCDDTNACTTDSCNVATGECANDAVEGCCVVDADCSDDDTCTMDSCSDMTCSNDEIAGCCTEDADCDDGDECTTDSCTVDTGACVNDMIEGCGMDAGVEDAGVDAGVDDGGMSDGGDEDAGDDTDAGEGDAGEEDAAVDAGGGASGGGCGCTIPGQSDSPLAPLFALIGFVFWQRRRR